MRSRAFDDIRNTQKLPSLREAPDVSPSCARNRLKGLAWSPIRPLSNRAVALPRTPPGPLSASSSDGKKRENGELTRVVGDLVRDDTRAARREFDCGLRWPQPSTLRQGRSMAAGTEFDFEDLLFAGATKEEPPLVTAVEPVIKLRPGQPAQLRSERPRRHQISALTASVQRMTFDAGGEATPLNAGEWSRPRGCIFGRKQRARNVWRAELDSRETISTPPAKTASMFANYSFVQDAGEVAYAVDQYAVCQHCSTVPWMCSGGSPQLWTAVAERCTKYCTWISGCNSCGNLELFPCARRRDLRATPRAEVNRFDWFMS